jgi:hypothetical protein
MENDANALFLPQVYRRKVLTGAKAGCIPLDAFGDRTVRADNRLPERFNLLLERVIE